LKLKNKTLVKINLKPVVAEVATVFGLYFLLSCQQKECGTEFA
jgi:hypothetical protein